MMAIDVFLKAISFSSPFVYAMATYALCAFLDRNASGGASSALSAWLRGGPYTGQHVSTLAVQIFDRLFLFPLLSTRAFTRSAFLTLFFTTLIIYASYPLIFLSYYYVPELRVFWAYFVFRNILLDYFSLFIVRKWLLVAGKNPFLALLLGPIVGVTMVYLVLIVLDVARFSLFDSGEFHLRYFAEGTREKIYEFRNHTANSWFTSAAFVVHGWMVVFAVGMGAAKLINSFRSAGAFAQWFLRGGEEHPYKAVGLVASLVVFLVAGALRLLI